MKIGVATTLLLQIDFQIDFQIKRTKLKVNLSK